MRRRLPLSTNPSASAPAAAASSSSSVAARGLRRFCRRRGPRGHHLDDRAAEAGVGAVILERQKRSFTSSLVELDIDFGKLATTNYLVCARSALAIARVRAVADLLVSVLVER